MRQHFNFGGNLMQKVFLKALKIILVISLTMLTTASVYAGSRTLFLEEEEKKDFVAGIKYLVSIIPESDMNIFKKLYYEQKIKTMLDDTNKTMYYKARDYVTENKGKVYSYDFTGETFDIEEPYVSTTFRAEYDEESNCWTGEFVTAYESENDYNSDFDTYRELAARELARNFMNDENYNESMKLDVKIKMIFPSGHLVELYHVTGEIRQPLFKVE